MGGVSSGKRPADARARSAMLHNNLANKPLLSAEEVGIMLGYSRATIYRAINKGELPLPLYKISGRWRIPRRAVERLVDGEPPHVPPSAQRPAAS